MTRLQHPYYDHQVQTSRRKKLCNTHYRITTYYAWFDSEVVLGWLYSECWEKSIELTKGLVRTKRRK